VKKMTFMIGGLFIALALLAGCAKRHIVLGCNLPTDNSAYHYFTAMGLIDSGDIAAAKTKLQRAVYCDDGFSPAYSALALVTAIDSKSIKDNSIKKVYVKRAFKFMKKARHTAKTDSDKFAYDVSGIRTFTALKTKEWFRESADLNQRAGRLKKIDFTKLPYYQTKDSAYYFMGIAYLQAGKFDKSRNSFASVLKTVNDKWHKPANREWRKVDRIVRAIGGISVGGVARKIAVLDKVSRADIAALLVNELRITKIMEGRIPAKSKIAKLKPDFIPVDIVNNPFKPEIKIIMKWHIRGLQPVYDSSSRAYLFEPYKPLTRRGFAFILEDILTKLTGDSSLPTKYFGQKNSPFLDVPPTAPWFNAVMNVTTRGLMEADLSGEFRPNAYIDGADALLAIRVLRETLNVY